MRKLLPYLCLLLLFCFGNVSAALAQAEASDVPPRPNPPRLVNDFAGMLTASERNALERKLVAYNDSTSTQIAVVTVKSIGPYAISDFAYRLGETWGIGGKGKNNGILILVALNERSMNISTGYGMEHIIPDAIAKRIIERTLKPAFQQQQYYQGIDNATNLIISMASGEYKADPKERERDGGGTSVIFIVLIVLIVLFFISRRGGGGGRGGRRSRTLGGPFIPPVIFGDFSGGRGIFGGGGGGFGGGGGGFGGFGGGSFGGGGASGKW